MSHLVALPTGAVTFLFTDIVGSTRLWERDPDQARATFALHARISRDAVEGAGGWLVKDTGDGFLAAFGDAAAAVDAAIDLQRALLSTPWRGPTPEVRMGLHTGPAEPVDGDYHAGTGSG